MKIKTNLLFCASEVSQQYKNIYIIDSVQWWDQIKNSYDPIYDLILTYDFGLKKKVSELGGQAFYIDHLIDPEIMQANNFLVYNFFRNWHYDADGKDIFIHDGIPFGFSFRLEFWNDFTFYVRTRICLGVLKNIKYQMVYIGAENDLVVSILNEIEISYKILTKNSQKQQPIYYFPIAQWMDEKLRAKGLRGILYRIREVITACYGYLMPWIDKLALNNKNKKAIFIQEYHPTKGLIAALRKDFRLRVVLANFSRGSKIVDCLFERVIPISGSIERYNKEVICLREKFESKKCVKLVLSDGQDISQSVYHIIEERVFARMANMLRTLDSAIKYIERNPINLEILIANIGHVATLVDCVCKQKGILSYLIINGMLGNDYLDESKYATVINCYSVSMRDNYFRGMSNVVCLGDSRMDEYALSFGSRILNKEYPTVTIGAAAFSNVDLNSYVAVEFEFMYDILTAFKIIIAQGFDVKLVIKTRPNGYREQYANFIKEFFPDLNIEIVSITPMKTVLEKSDFYISTYSQTLFEASCLGIPCVYYKKDDEIMDTPFDRNSELVTVDNIDDLIQAFLDFKTGHERYHSFLEKAVLEKYIGPLDGKNLQRNIDFVYKLLARQEESK